MATTAEGSFDVYGARPESSASYTELCSGGRIASVQDIMDWGKAGRRTAFQTAAAKRFSSSFDNLERPFPGSTSPRSTSSWSKIPARQRAGSFDVALDEQDDPSMPSAEVQMISVSEAAPVAVGKEKKLGGFRGRNCDQVMEGKAIELFRGTSTKPPAGTTAATSTTISGNVPDQISYILVLYCGGTIGMRTKSGVYAPEPKYLVTELRKLPICHDQSYWSTQLPGDYDRNETLVMPLSKEGRRVLYNVVEYDPLLDSSNMTFDDYTRLANDIQDNYTKYDAFVVLHGTDTMAYTASALSFMLEHLGKPVVLTGSQIPIFEPRSDGRHNFIGALIVAAHYNIPEVSIFFDSVLLRGNRSTKIDNGSFDAFASPNMQPLATVGVSIKVNWETIFRHRGLNKFRVHTRMCRNVGVLRLFPGITEMTVRAFLQPPMQGVVLQTYGQGNGPTARADIMAALKEACERGVIIVNTTQCSRGVVSPIYAVGKELQDLGIVAGSDMTVEAALMKLSYILGKGEWPLHEKRQRIGVSLRGEMSTMAKHDRRLMHFSLIETLAETMRLSSAEEIQLLREAVFPYLLCAASREGSIEALERLRQAGAQFHMSDYDGRSPLHVACCEGHTHVVQYLLDLGAPVHVRDRYGDSPLDDAVTFRHADIIRLLRDTGAHLTMPPTKLAQAVSNVVVSEDADALEYWAEAGADIATLADHNGRTALHVAVANGLYDHVTVLLNYGANPMLPDSAGSTPLDEATQRNDAEMIQLLKRKVLTSRCSSVSGGTNCEY